MWRLPAWLCSVCFMYVCPQALARTRACPPSRARAPSLLACLLQPLSMVGHFLLEGVLPSQGLAGQTPPIGGDHDRQMKNLTLQLHFYTRACALALRFRFGRWWWLPEVGYTDLGAGCLIDLGARPNSSPSILWEGVLQEEAEQRCRSRCTNDPRCKYYEYGWGRHKTLPEGASAAYCTLRPALRVASDTPTLCAGCASTNTLPAVLTVGACACAWMAVRGLFHAIRDAALRCAVGLGAWHAKVARVRLGRPVGVAWPPMAWPARMPSIHELITCAA